VLIAQSGSAVGALGRSSSGAGRSQRILKTSDFDHSAVAHGSEAEDYITRATVLSIRREPGKSWRGISAQLAVPLTTVVEISRRS
jgi:hypothetical protein